MKKNKEERKIEQPKKLKGTFSWELTEAQGNAVATALQMLKLDFFEGKQRDALLISLNMAYDKALAKENGK